MQPDLSLTGTCCQLTPGTLDLAQVLSPMLCQMGKFLAAKNGRHNEERKFHFLTSVLCRLCGDAAVVL